MKRRWKILLWIGLPILAFSLYYAALRITAKAALARYKAELIAKGEKLTVAELIPPRLLHTNNAAAEFMNASAYLISVPGQVEPPAMSMTGPGRARISWQRDVLLNLISSNVWPGLKAHFETNGNYLADVRKTFSEGLLRFQIDYLQGFTGLPSAHLMKIKSCSQSLSAAAILAMHEGNTSEAFENLRGLAALPRACEGEASMITQLVRAAMIAIAARATWEGLQYTGLQERQLADLQQLWDSIPVLSRAAPCFELERVWSSQEFNRCRADPSRLNGVATGMVLAQSPLDEISDLAQNVIEDPEKGWNAVLDRFPRQWAWRGWNSFRDELWFLKFSQSNLDTARELQSVDAVLPTLSRLESRLAQGDDPPPGLLVSHALGTGVWQKFLHKILTAETQRRIVATAIALRRYQKRHNEPAPDLSALCPDILASVPLDPMDGQSLRYKLNSDGTFLLYSIGLNGKDEGGDTSGSNRQFWWTSGNDWVWPTPASEQEVKDYETRKERERKPGKR